MEGYGPLWLLPSADSLWYNIPQTLQEGYEKMGNIQAIIHKCEPPETGYWAEVPSLPGCVSEGETFEECQAMIREAATGWLESAWMLAMQGRENAMRPDDVLTPVFA